MQVYLTQEINKDLGSSTGNELPSYTIIQDLGTVYNYFVRSMCIPSNIGSGFQSFIGGKLKPITKILRQSRALERIVFVVKSVSSNCIYGFTDDLPLFGTAVFIETLP